jgi:hypothetical protein
VTGLVGCSGTGCVRSATHRPCRSSRLEPEARIDAGRDAWVVFDAQFDTKREGLLVARLPAIQPSRDAFALAWNETPGRGRARLTRVLGCNMLARVR